MKKIISSALCAGLILSSCCFAAGSEEAESYTELFEKDNIININIDIDEADLADMLEYARNEEYHSADITVNGITVENAGIRTKGNMTLSSVADSDSDRYSYRIKFNKYVKGNKLLGLDDLCLNNNYSDPSYMREYLHYEILEQLGMNVPERAYCSVSINGEPAGFYLAVEALDGTFLESKFGENYKNGNFYSMDEGADLLYHEDEMYSYAELKSGSDEDMTGLKTFIKTLNEMPEGEKGDIESCLDVDSALKYIASNTVLCNYDSYNGNMHHNYYLYEDENGIFTVVPWDFNMSFGGFDGSRSDVGIDTPVTSGSLDELPLIGKLLSVPEYKEKYYGYIEQIMNLLDGFEERVDELKELIGSYVENDPTAFYSYEEFENAVSASESNSSAGETGSSANRAQRPGGGMGSVSIIDCVNDRLESLAAQLNGEAETSTETAQSGFGGDMGGGRGFGGSMPPSGKMPPGGDFDIDGTIPEGGTAGADVAIAPGESRPGGGAAPENQNDPNSGSGAEAQQSGPSAQNGRPGSGRGGAQPGDAMPGFGSREQAIRVHVDGHIISFESDPYISNDSALVGVRAILEALGADVSWDENSRTVTISKEDTVIKLTVGNETAYVNDEPSSLAAVPEMSGDSVMIPVRFISEQLGMNVSWDESSRLITIVSK